MMLTAVTYQNLVNCLFYCILCVHFMGMSSTGVFIYYMPSLQRCMPCIFVISVVTSTSMQTRLHDVSDFRDLVISPSPVLFAISGSVYCIITPCILLRFACMIYLNVRLEMLFILFHYAMLIWVHLDAQILGARVLYAVTCCYLSELGVLLVLLHLMCASYE